MRFDLRPSARAFALGAALVIVFAAQDRARATQRRGARRRKSFAASVTASTDWRKSPKRRTSPGQSEGYLIEQITAFKSGERKNEMMSVVVQDLSDADIENLAAYYSGIEISVKTPAQ